MLLTGIRPASVRFAFSPLQEVLRALGVFANPRRHAEQMAWVRAARRRATPALKREIARFGFLLSPTAELFPQVLPARDAGATLDEELALLRSNAAAFNAAMVRRMLGKALMHHDEIEAASRPAALRRLAKAAAARDVQNAALLRGFAVSPARTRRDLCALVEAFYECALKPEWDGFEARALDDARARTRLMERFGITAMLRTLSRRVSASGNAREAAMTFGGSDTAQARLAFDAAATLSLTPSSFIWPHATIVVLRRERLDVRITYPLSSPMTVRPRTAAWTDAARRFAALGDPLRLTLLDLLRDRSLSTRELAGFTSLGESTVSRHLAVLREANLVTSRRDGYFVLYDRTRDAETLLAAVLQRDGALQA
jgi:DNA-binding transcriptional ArsR family regulator